MAKTKTKSKPKKSVLDTIECEIFKRKELLRQTNKDIGAQLQITPATVARRSKTKTYEHLREMALLELDEQFDGNVMRHWAKMVFTLANAKKKSNVDFASMKEALHLIQDTLGLDAPKIEKHEHTIGMLDNEQLSAAVDEALAEFEQCSPNKVALPPGERSAGEDPVDDTA